MDIGSSYVQGVQLWEFETEDTPAGNHDISAKQLKPMSNMYPVIRNEELKNLGGIWERALLNLEHYKKIIHQGKFTSDLSKNYKTNTGVRGARFKEKLGKMLR